MLFYALINIAILSGTPFLFRERNMHPETTMANEKKRITTYEHAEGGGATLPSIKNIRAGGTPAAEHTDILARERDREEIAPLPREESCYGPDLVELLLQPCGTEAGDRPFIDQEPWVREYLAQAGRFSSIPAADANRRAVTETAPTVLGICRPNTKKYSRIGSWNASTPRTIRLRGTSGVYDSTDI